MISYCRGALGFLLVSFGLPTVFSRQLLVVILAPMASSRLYIVNNFELATGNVQYCIAIQASSLLFPGEMSI